MHAIFRSILVLVPFARMRRAAALAMPESCLAVSGADVTIKLKSLFLLAALLNATHVLGANYPLEIINIKPAGTGNPAISANNRIFKAYPGLPYNIRAAVIGGAYPYKFYLTEAPGGMTINADSGEIDWPNPQSSAAATVRVVDSEGSEATASWAIDITTTGFRFVDASAPDGGNGSLANPWNEIVDFYTSSKWDSTYAGEFLYFRDGVYVLRGELEDGVRLPLYAGRKPEVWMAFPGERPVLDLEFNYRLAPFIGNFYIDGMEFRNMAGYGIETGGEYNYQTYRNLYMHDLDGSLISGHNNQSFIRVMGGSTAAMGSYMVVENSLFSNAAGPMSGIKFYSKQYSLVEDNTFADFSGENEGVALKMSTRRVTVRNNRLQNVGDRGITCEAWIGTDGIGIADDNEILFNLVYGSALPLNLGGNNYLGPTHVYRNTLVGGVPWVRYINGAQGPIRFYDNVIVNAEGDSGSTSGNGYSKDHIYFNYSPNAYGTSVLLSGNLLGFPADNIVDDSFPYFLTSSYGQYVGLKGYEKGAGSCALAGDCTPPSPPTNLSVQ